MSDKDNDDDRYEPDEGGEFRILEKAEKKKKKKTD
jgi:hypothetical protein